MSTHMWLRSIAYRLGQVRQQLGFVTSLTGEDYKEVARALPSSAALSLFCTMSPADQQHALRVCRGLQARGSTDEDMLAAALLHDVGKAQGRVPFWTRPAIVLGKKLAPQLLSRLVIYPVGAGEEACGEGTLASPPSEEQELALSIGCANPGTMGDPRVPTTSLPHSRPYGFDVTLSQISTSECGRRDPIYRVPRGAGQDPSIVGAIPCGRPVPVLAHDRPAPGRAYPTATIPKWRQSLSNAWYHAEIGADLASAAGLSDHAVLYIRTHHQPGGPAAELHEVDEVS